MLDLFPSRDAGPFGRRLKRARGARIPVTIVAGFLGAGKTTLVRRFLAAPEGQHTAVVINEYGAVGIDDALVRDSADEITLLGNGCLCCNTRSDLQVALRRLVAERERGAVPAFGRIVIETSGLADPGPILQTFSTDRALGGEFFVEVVLAVVGAIGGLDTLEWSAEARKQVILADWLVISKTDLVEPQAVERLRERRHSELRVDRRCAAPLGRLRARHGDADGAARARSLTGQRLPQRRRLPRARSGASRAAPRPSAGRARLMAGPKPCQPARLHHPQHPRNPGAEPFDLGAHPGRRRRFQLAPFGTVPQKPVRGVFPIAAG